MNNPLTAPNIRANLWFLSRQRRSGSDIIYYLFASLARNFSFLYVVSLLAAIVWQQCYICVCQQGALVCQYLLQPCFKMHSFREIRITFPSIPVVVLCWVYTWGRGYCVVISYIVFFFWASIKTWKQLTIKYTTFSFTVFRAICFFSCFCCWFVKKNVPCTTWSPTIPPTHLKYKIISINLKGKQIPTSLVFCFIELKIKK